jgi:hypothetical protein
VHHHLGRLLALPENIGIALRTCYDKRSSLFCRIVSYQEWGLYNKTSSICDVRKMRRICSKLVSLLLSVVFTSVYVILKLQVCNVLCKCPWSLGPT